MEYDANAKFYRHVAVERQLTLMIQSSIKFLETDKNVQKNSSSFSNCYEYSMNQANETNRGKTEIINYV